MKKNFTKKNKATKIFQALRMFVNNEISELITGLSKSSNLISKNG
ncbi:MAG: 16S rRNA (cytosine(1402)-N(4))-methyltransferase, partial [Candidatus Latescibacterota bacterium]|nr:16S rRNA (cytosine(1402)-N(4))-methyltransferase [Candidatus Latescibacterota bacterium]